MVTLSHMTKWIDEKIIEKFSDTKSNLMCQRRKKAEHKLNQGRDTKLTGYLGFDRLHSTCLSYHLGVFCWEKTRLIVDLRHCKYS